jgi:putative FmdB family regulatory protein
MPLYEYACPGCGLRFERLERVSAPAPCPCPTCGAAAPRLLGAPALQFKGSGWYVTDYGKGRSSASTAAGESAAPAPPAKPAASAA